MGSANTAVIPVPKLENDFYDWFERHERKRQEAIAGNHEWVFIGDSITHLFEGHPGIHRGEAVWRDHFAARALNLGFGWDRTQNVLWRLEQGEFTGQSPRLIVLLIGTNNLTGTANARENTPEEIAGGVEAICRKLAVLSPSSRILLMGLLPRGFKPDDPFRPKIAAVNTLLAGLPFRLENVQFLDIGPRLVEPDGSISPAIMDDGCHPTEAGYRIWTDTLLDFTRSR